MRVPDDMKHPSGGEHIDDLAKNVLHLAHEVIERFPDVKRKHMFIAGGAAVSSALIVATTVAISKRIRAGESPQEAVNGVTEEEISGLHLVEREHYRPQKPGEQKPGEPARDSGNDAEAEPDDDESTAETDGAAEATSPPVNADGASSSETAAS